MPPPILLVMLLIPVIVGIAGWRYGGNRLTWWELAIQIGVVCALLIGGYVLGQWATTHDHEIWSGRMKYKPSGRQKCCHTYRCNCRRSCTGSGGHRSCSTRCSTCRRHKYDLYWVGVSNLGERVYENKCNKPGTPTPASWTAIRIGEPTAHAHSYTNYVRAAPRKFLRGSEQLVARWRSRLPKYPPVLGYRARRLLTIGVEVPDVLQHDSALAAFNSDLFARHRTNVIFVVTSAAEREYFDALARKWFGGKRNDVVVVVSTPAYPRIGWVRVMAWTPKGRFGAKLARAVEKLGRFDPKRAMAIVKKHVDASYKRRSDKSFRNRAGRVAPPTWMIIALFVGGLVLSGILQAVFLFNRHRRAPPPPEPPEPQAYAHAPERGEAYCISCRAYYTSSGGSCPTCQRPNSDNARRKRPKICFSCQAVFPANKKRCDACGGSLIEPRE